MKVLKELVTRIGSARIGIEASYDTQNQKLRLKAVQRKLRNLTLNYLEWGINDVAIRVIKPDVL